MASDEAIRAAVNEWIDYNDCRYGTAVQTRQSPFSPARSSEAAFFDAGRGVDSVIRKVDHFLAGRIDGALVAEAFPTFESLDTNGDGVITREEWQQALLGPSPTPFPTSPPRSTVAPAPRTPSVPVYIPAALAQPTQPADSPAGLGSNYCKIAPPDAWDVARQAAEFRERSFFDAERAEAETLLAKAQAQLEQLNSVQHVEAQRDRLQEENKAYFLQIQGLESKVRAAERSEAAAQAERDQAVLALQKSKEKGDRDTEKVIRLMEEKEEITGMQGEHYLRTTAERDAAIVRQQQAEAKLQQVEHDYHQLRDQMNVLMDSWDQKQRRTDATVLELRCDRDRLTEELDAAREEVRGLQQRAAQAEATVAAQSAEGSARHGSEEEKRLLSAMERRWVERLFAIISNGGMTAPTAVLARLMTKFVPDQVEPRRLLKTMKLHGAHHSGMDLESFSSWCGGVLGAGLTEPAFVDGMKELLALAQLASPVSGI